MIDTRISVEAMFIPAKPDAGDPLGQRGYLAVKVSGGAHEAVLDGDVHTAFSKLREGVVKQVEGALLAALQAPDTTVSA
jgi:hypothetical protein